MDYFTDGMSLLSTTTLFLEIFDMETTDDKTTGILLWILQKKQHSLFRTKI